MPTNREAVSCVANVCLGQPIAGSPQYTIELQDAGGHPCPAGQTGEVVISGSRSATAM